MVGRIAQYGYWTVCAVILYAFAFDGMSPTELYRYLFERVDNFQIASMHNPSRGRLSFAVEGWTARITSRKTMLPSAINVSRKKKRRALSWMGPTNESRCHPGQVSAANASRDPTSASKLDPG